MRLWRRFWDWFTGPDDTLVHAEMLENPYVEPVVVREVLTDSRQVLKARLERAEDALAVCYAAAGVTDPGNSVARNVRVAVNDYYRQYPPGQEGQPRESGV